MSRRNQLAGLDPWENDDNKDQDKRQSLSMTDADAALFGELARLEGQRKNVNQISIFNIYPDVKQPRRAVPLEVRRRWSGEPKDTADLFTVWWQTINEERQQAGRPAFDLDDSLWAEAMENRQRDEDDLAGDEEAGPMERAFLKVIELAVSIRRDTLANPVTVQRLDRSNYKLETGERRWLAYHLLYTYFHGEGGRPDERDQWSKIPATVVEDFNVWRQASENTARADLNAIGRARQYAILLMDLLERKGERFQPYDALVRPGEADRAYYAQVAEYRVPKGKGEMLANGMGVSHRAAFHRSRALLNLPDEVWVLGDNFDISEDELLRLAKMEPPEVAVAEARRLVANVASRNNSAISGSDKPRKDKSAPPALPRDAALKRGKRLFSKENERLAVELLRVRDGVGQANKKTKRQLLDRVAEMRRWLDELETAING